MHFASERTKLLPKPSLAKVDEVIQDRIRVRWQATYWDTYVYVENISSHPLELLPGQAVTVIGIKGTRLVVLL